MKGTLVTDAIAFFNDSFFFHRNTIILITFMCGKKREYWIISLQAKPERNIWLTKAQPSKSRVGVTQ